jgi:signal transduction histidine kinase
VFASIILLLIIAIANLSLGYIIYSRNKNLLANKVFLIISITLTGWMLSNFFLQQSSGNLRIANILNSIAYTLGFLAIYSAFLFSQIYPKKSRLIQNKNKIYILSFLAVIFSIFSATHAISGEVIASNSGIGFIDGPLEGVYTAVSLILVVFIIARYLSVAKQTHGAERAQVFFIMGGLAFSILVGLFANLVLPLFGITVSFEFYSPLTSLIVISFIAYAITRHGLFDVRPFIARSLAYIFSISALFGLFILTAILALKTFLGTEVKLNEALFFALLSVLLAIVYQPTKKFFDKISNNIFYRDSYDPQDVINSINSKLVNTLDLNKLLSTTSQLIEDKLKISYCSFWLHSDASSEFRFIESSSNKFTKVAWSKLSDFLSQENPELVLYSDTTLESKVRHFLKELSIEAIFKMTSTGDSVGYMVVGGRRSGSSFTAQDIQLLEIIAGEVAIAAQNALRYEEISKFAETLQTKINNATRELQKSNEKLKALDSAKDEFISMASHQLRTPLTSVKGYISMILEGDAGEINDLQKKFLNQAFISSQRMVYLISDLLNVSRLKTGKFVIENRETYLPDTVEDELRQLDETIKARGLSIEYKKPKKFPIVMLDEDKVRQVIMNFADNAIYYTPAGGKIFIELKATDDVIQYTVKDTGIGVPRHEQHHLFTKFYRAGNARKARPDGTGLGLFMAKKVITAQGGSILFTSEEGKGSTFGFSLPRKKVEKTS